MIKSVKKQPKEKTKHKGPSTVCITGYIGKHNPSYFIESLSFSRRHANKNKKETEAASYSSTLAKKTLEVYRFNKQERIVLQNSN